MHPQIRDSTRQEHLRETVGRWNASPTAHIGADPFLKLGKYVHTSGTAYQALECPPRLRKPLPYLVHPWMSSCCLYRPQRARLSRHNATPNVSARPGNQSVSCHRSFSPPNAPEPGTCPSGCDWSPRLLSGFSLQGRPCGGKVQKMLRVQSSTRSGRPAGACVATAAMSCLVSSDTQATAL